MDFLTPRAASHEHTSLIPKQFAWCMINKNIIRFFWIYQSDTTAATYLKAARSLRPFSRFEKTNSGWNYELTLTLHCTSVSQTMVNDTTPDIARTPHAFIKRVGCLGQRVGCAIYAEEAVTNTMMGRLSNTLHLKTDSMAMSLSHTILLNRCINKLFFNQEKVDMTSFFLSVHIKNFWKSNRFMILFILF